MTVLSIMSIIVGILGVMFGLECYRRLHEWARLCQNGRIFIAYKNRVQLDAPITDFVQWTRMLKDDQNKVSTGRVIYHAKDVKVGLFRPRSTASGTTLEAVKTAVAS